MTSPENLLFGAFHSKLELHFEQDAHIVISVSLVIF